MKPRKSQTKALTTETTVASRGNPKLLRPGRGNFGDNRYNNDSYLEEADMSS
jgi:hypothetical protein